MTDKELVTQYKTLLVQAAHILLSAENSITESYEQGKTANEIAGTVIDVPAQLKQVSTLIETVLILNQRQRQSLGKPQLYPANVNGKRVMVSIPED